MKRIFALGTVVTLIAVAFTACNTPRPGTAGRPITLFNGKNLEGWDYVLAKSNVPREAVWSVRDGVLICKGDPLGVLHTERLSPTSGSCWNTAGRPAPSPATAAS